MASFSELAKQIMSEAAISSEMEKKIAKWNKKYTHFAIRKADGKIVNGWDYKSLYDRYDKKYDNESIREYSKEDLEDMFPEDKFRDFSILTRAAMEKKGY